MKVKAHLVIPKEILEEVDQIAGKRGRSLFITEAALEKLERERFLKILEETRGAWTDQRHPDLRSSRDLETYLHKQRFSLQKRLDQLERQHKG
jgi:metal-responsive CopG/Arc/MetJ family transcriptional regulator